jgi:two-component system, chemotaxis family, sensor kinase CheA
MSCPATADRSGEVQSLLLRLAETIARTEADDLSGLAQLHGWCEALIDIGTKDRSTVNDDMAQRTSKLARALEGLILGEVSSATETLAGIVTDIQQLTAEFAKPSSTLPEPAEDNLNSQQAAECLAGSFDENPEWCFEADVAEPPAAEESAGRSAEAAPVEPADLSETAYVSQPLIIDVKELEFVKGFVEEAREHVEAIEAAVLEVERCPDDAARIDDLFRPFHTIKGMAGFLNLRDIGGLTHEVETLLDQGRKGKRTVTTGVIDLVLSVVDVLKLQVAGISAWVREPTSSPVPQPPVSEMIDRLRAVVAGQLDPDEGTDVGRHKSDETRNDERTSDEVTPAQTLSSLSSPAAAEPAVQAGPKMSDRSIRIDTEKLDGLIDMVGELVIAQTLVGMSEDASANPKLARDVTQVTKIVRDVQELAMAMRMVPIGQTFQKMARLVRDVSRKAGKQVNLNISGEDTELDKTVIQEIGDPLVHMVRNAVDHGIEAPDERRRAGKPEVGQLHLHAGHEGGNILISIHDDGKGLDPEVLLAKGIEKGLVAPDAELTEQQIFSLILAPGFSTAAQVTDISGRGVGMDVVKRNIDQLRGRVEITSEKGKGTTFNIRLPLTLAIIDGMVIRVGHERFILPTISIQQSLRPLPEAITNIHHRGEVLNVRGEMIPLIQLGELFGLTGRINPCEAMVIIAHCESRLVGLVVEELIGQQQVVIKTLGEQFERLQGVSGAAILGDGRVGLILEMTGLSLANGRTDHTGCEIPAETRLHSPIGEP